MAIFLVILIGLMIWSLQLLQCSIKSRDLSLALASGLVGVSAVGVVMVYMLMDGYMSYFATPRLAEFPSDTSVSIPAMLYESDQASLTYPIELAGANNSVPEFERRVN
jgi:hypothetical protein